MEDNLEVSFCYFMHGEEGANNLKFLIDDFEILQFVSSKNQTEWQNSTIPINSGNYKVKFFLNYQFWSFDNLLWINLLLSD